MRTGDDVRVSAAMTVASPLRKPRLRCPKSLKPARKRVATNCGIQKWSGEDTKPGE